MQTKKISVIVPCYNVEQYLPKCLVTLTNQSYPELEIICVVDGSPDNSLAICQSFAEKDARVIVIDQPNQGAAAARNNGLSKATGEYVMFADADDWLETDTCRKAIASAEAYDSDVVIWSYVREFAGSSKPKDVFQRESGDFIPEEVAAAYRRLFGLYEEELAQPENADSLVTIWGKLYKRELLEGVYFVPSTQLITSEDLLYNIEVFARVKRISYIHEYLYHYRKDNEASVTTVYKAVLFEQWNALYARMEQQIEEQQLGETFLQALNNRIALSLIGLGLNALANPEGIGASLKELKTILSTARYRRAYKTLTLKYFPLHWKLFFFLAKHRCIVGVLLLLKAIEILIG